MEGACKCRQQPCLTGEEIALLSDAGALVDMRVQPDSGQRTGALCAPSAAADRSAAARRADGQDMAECLEEVFECDSSVLDMARLGPRALALYQEGYESVLAQQGAEDADADDANGAAAVHEAPALQLRQNFAPSPPPRSHPSLGY